MDADDVEMCEDYYQHYSQAPITYWVVDQLFDQNLENLIKSYVSLNKFICGTSFGGKADDLLQAF